MERANKTIAEVANEVVVREPKQKETERLISIGSTLLNLAMSDNYEGGVAQGKIINVIGESSAGKTMVCETMLAEAANNPEYDDYRLILDDSEHAHEIDSNYMFGKKAAARIEAPRYDDDDEPVYSDTVEQFIANVNRVLDSGDSVIYCLDSLDTLTDDTELTKVDEYIAVADGTKREVSGSYGMQKAKLLSQFFRVVKKKLADTRSVLVIISQTRDNIGAMGFAAPKKTRAGGKALEFYCTHVIWLSAIKSLTATVNNEKIKIGNQVKAEVKKNKLTGKIRSVEFPIYYDYGIDDLSSCIDFLCDAGVFTSKAGYITGLGYEKKRMKDFVKLIEDNDQIDDVRQLVAEEWERRENSLKLGRKPRFE